ncbi:MAG: hypothetical protein NTU95_09160 [Methanothrix sp.]|nr:hypothetical protein [Methanothrix sp.]
MARDLNEKDLQILIKLVPELEVLQKKGIEIEYLNILPPVANHHSRSVQEFEQRLKKLSVEDMRYLADLVLEGTESSCCLRPDFAEVFFTVAGQRLSESVADQLREAYESGEGCGG